MWRNSQTSPRPKDEVKEREIVGETIDYNAMEILG